MRTISVTEMSTRGLSGALRQAAIEPVLVSRDGEPFVVILDAQPLLAMVQAETDTSEGAGRKLVAVHLFDQGALSLGRAARMAGLGLPQFVDLCDRLHVAVIREPASAPGEEVDAFEAWLRRAR